MKNVFIMMSVLIVLVGGVLLWDSLRNNTINKTITNDVAEDLSNLDESSNDDSAIEEMSEPKDMIGEDDAEKDTSAIEATPNTDKFYESSDLALSLYYPNDWNFEDGTGDITHVDFMNYEIQEGYLMKGDILMTISLLDGTYNDVYARNKEYITKGSEGYNEGEIITDEDVTLNGKSGKKLVTKNDKPFEGSAYDSLDYFLTTDNDKYYTIHVIHPQNNDDLLAKTEKIIQSISWE